jgi:type IV pilus assembly protein PilB
MAARPLRLGQSLVDSGRLEHRHLRAALDEQQGSGRRLGDILVRRGYVDDMAVARSLASQLRLPFAEGPLICEAGALLLVDARLARARAVLPLSATDRTLRLAVADPLDQDTLEELRFSSGRHVEPIVAARSTIAEGIRSAYEGELAELVRNLPAYDADPEDDRTLRAAAAAAPVVRLVDHILHHAAALGASDIHLEPFAGRVLIRYRIDGVLRRFLTLPGSGMASITSRIKVMSGMDISVKRKPQDGGLAVEHAAGSLRIRASTLPVAGGEKIVLRLLDPLQVPRNLDGLGFSVRDASLVRRLAQTGQGVLLTAGPTGSGKSSSLFAALAELNQEGLNVVTVEDPMEYQLPGINQVQVSPLAGLTFPAALRAILRQDPDVVMVGEIRDRETAEIAMGAAVTGHLVLSTIHATDAPGAITRLLHMGVPPHLVAGGLSAVVAQRLVRTFCRFCRGRNAEACTRCGDGYSGRTGVFQVLAMNDAIRDQIMRGASTSDLGRLASESGMASLTEDVMRKVAEGLTSPHEAARVIQSDAGAVVPCPGCGGEVPWNAMGCPHCGRVARRLCACGAVVRKRWRFCAACLRPAAA